MLPQHTTLSVTHWANSSENHTTKLLPYIGRIQELKLRMTVEDYTDLWQMLSPTQLANLTSLHLGFPDTEVLQTAVQDWRSVTLFKLVKRLRRLALTSPQDFTPTLLSLDVPWGQLIELHIDLENLSFQTAVSILQKSSALEGLVLRVYESEEAVGDFISGRILLPHLKTLRITVNDASMFHALIVPTLTSLHITETQMNSQDLSPDILHFLATSGCSLTSFTYKRATRSPCPLTLLRDLLGVLHGVTRFAAPDVMFCEEVMRDFACCALLPRVQDLGFCAPTREALVHMLEQRMQVEAKRGAVTLRRVNGTDHDRAHGPLRSTLFFYTLAGTSYS
ncbi:hypothetical protein H0H81_001689 [Sphagnurus paluster]|uniref:Uncharacterized protein n=1 Tax=Sphagnurus paluster TaxID=117069 RepID=A0A9P7GU84_9AGAR|nr:hypothetical protein H0H81_001689 [Sphagnurus paluster]